MRVPTVVSNSREEIQIALQQMGLLIEQHVAQALKPKAPVALGGGGVGTPNYANAALVAQAGVGAINSLDYLTNSDKIILVNGWFQELAIQCGFTVELVSGTYGTAIYGVVPYGMGNVYVGEASPANPQPGSLDWRANQVGVSHAAYDATIEALYIGLIEAGAPQNWDEVWPDGQTFAVAGIETVLQGWWQNVAQARTALQNAITTASNSWHLVNFGVGALPALPSTTYPPYYSVITTDNFQVQVNATGTGWNYIVGIAQNLQSGNYISALSASGLPVGFKLGGALFPSVDVIGNSFQAIAEFGGPFNLQGYDLNNLGVARLYFGSNGNIVFTTANNVSTPWSWTAPVMGGATSYRVKVTVVAGGAGGEGAGGAIVGGGAGAFFQSILTVTPGNVLSGNVGGGGPSGGTTNCTAGLNSTLNFAVGSGSNLTGLTPGLIETCGGGTIGAGAGTGGGMSGILNSAGWSPYTDSTTFVGGDLIAKWIGGAGGGQVSSHNPGASGGFAGSLAGLGGGGSSPFGAGGAGNNAGAGGNAATNAYGAGGGGGSTVGGAGASGVVILEFV